MLLTVREFPYKAMKIQHNTRFNSIDLHYLSKSFEFYPCTCKTNRTLNSNIYVRCKECLLSYITRVSQMKTKF